MDEEAQTPVWIEKITNALLIFLYAVGELYAIAYAGFFILCGLSQSVLDLYLIHSRPYGISRVFIIVYDLFIIVWGPWHDRKTEAYRNHIIGRVLFKAIIFLSIIMVVMVIAIDKKYH